MEGADWREVENRETENFINRIRGIMNVYCPDLTTRELDDYALNFRDVRSRTGNIFIQSNTPHFGYGSYFIPYPTRGSVIDYERSIMGCFGGELFQQRRVRGDDGRMRWEIAFQMNNRVKLYFEIQYHENAPDSILLSFFNRKHWKHKKDALIREGWRDANSAILPDPQPFPPPPAHVDVLARLTERVARLESNFLP